MANGERSALMHNDGVEGISGYGRMKSRFQIRNGSNRLRHRRQAGRKVERSRQVVVDLGQRRSAYSKRKEKNKDF